MARRDSAVTNRRLVTGLIVFGLFVVCDIALFGYLIFDSLSQREIEKILIQTRTDAEPIARRLEEDAAALGQDLWVVMSFDEAQAYLEAELAQRDLVQRLELRGPDGSRIFSQVDQPAEEDGETPAVSAVDANAADGLTLPPAGWPTVEDIEIPIGELGTLVIGVAPEMMQQRIGVLRRDLLRQAWLIGGLTVSLLFAASLAIWQLFRRGRALEDQAHEAERMAYVGTLASGLAHEIRNPLNALSLNMQMLHEEAEEGSGLGRSGGRLLAITQSEIGRLEHLVTDFLSYAKPRELALEEASGSELFEPVRSVLAGEVRARGAELVIDDRSDGARVRVDREQFRQLLLNLTQNALQATERVDRTPQVRLVARRQGQYVALAVTDNGIGLSAKARERMFEIFYSTRKGGTGLGLAIVQRIVKDHEGRIEVDSVEGKGTTIRILLPRVGARQSVTQTLTLPVLDSR